MATMYFNLQSVLLLSHNIQDVRFKNDDERYPYQSLKFAKNCSQNAKNSKIMLFLFSCGIIVAMATSRMTLQSFFLFLNHNIQ